jgi:molybdopterin-guanine dinucleotide biosynthesis protein B
MVEGNEEFIVIPTLALIGYSNSGKTTVMQELVQILRRRGFIIAVVKHAAHGYQADSEGTDSWSYAKAGADKVVIAGQDSLTIHDYAYRGQRLADIVAKIDGVDIVLVEGFKNEPGPKVEVYRQGFSEQPLTNVKGRLALVSDVEREANLPRFTFDALEALTDFIVESLGLDQNG